MLRPEEVNPATGSFTVLQGKGGKSRGADLDPEAVALVKRWLRVRKVLGIDPRRPLFYSLKGGPLHSAYLRRLLPRFARKGAIAKPVHPQGLLHTDAVQQVAEAVPTDVVEAKIDPANLPTADVYLRRVAAAEVLDAMRRREWSL